MQKEDLYKMIGIEPYKDFEEMKARDFENLISSELKKYGEIKRQVTVEDRGDGHRGRIDLCFKPHNFWYAIEIDRKQPREKSKFKIRYFSSRRGFIILRAPYQIIEV
jgi:hypothetical protein